MAWTTPRTWVAEELVTAAIMNAHVRDNLNALKSPVSQQVLRDNNANYTTTSTSFVDVDTTNLKITLVTQGGDVLVWFGGIAANSAVTDACFTVQVDSTDAGLAEGLTTKYGGTASHVSFVYLVTGLSASSHTFTLRWKTASAGTATLFCGSGALPDVPVIFGAREVS